MRVPLGLAKEKIKQGIRRHDARRIVGRKTGTAEEVERRVREKEGGEEVEGERVRQVGGFPQEQLEM